jgi:predicted dehydrogenase
MLLLPGGSLLSIPLMHTLDGISTVLGEFKSISALESTQITKVQLADKEDETLTRTSPDNILLHGQLQGGAVMVVQYKGASGYAEQGGFDFRWEILGDKGTIVVKADIGHMQVRRAPRPPPRRPS